MRDGMVGVCIWRKLGSFWNIVIFSPMGVGGGEVDSSGEPAETNTLVGRVKCGRVACCWCPEVDGALIFRRRSLIDVARLGGGID